MYTMEANEIKSTIEKAYVQGIHTIQKRELIDAGFHSDFEMLVLNDKQLEKTVTKIFKHRIMDGFHSSSHAILKGPVCKNALISIV